MKVENVEALRVWLSKTLSPICDADPEILAKYVLALIKKDKPVEDLKDLCENQLDIFLQAKTKQFVKQLFEVINSGEYLATTDTSAVRIQAITSGPPAVEVKPTLTQQIPVAVSSVNPSAVISLKTPSQPEVKQNIPVANVMPHMELYETRLHTENFPVGAEQDRMTEMDRKSNVDAANRFSGAYHDQQNSRLSGSGHIESPGRRDHKRRLSPVQSSSNYYRQRSPGPDLYSSRTGNRRPNIEIGRHGGEPGHDLGRRGFEHRSPEHWSRSRSRTRSRSPSRSRIIPHRQLSRSPSPVRLRSRSGSPSNKKFKSSDGLPVTIPPINPYVSGDSDRDRPHLPGGPSIAVNRCRDYDEKGYCVRGDMCPYDHGTDPLVLDDVPPVIGFSGMPSIPVQMLPQHIHSIPRVPHMIRTDLPPPPLPALQFRPTIAGPPPYANAPAPHGMPIMPMLPPRRLAPPPHVVEPYMPQPYSPKTSLFQPPPTRPGYALAGDHQPNGACEVVLSASNTNQRYDTPNILPGPVYPAADRPTAYSNNGPALLARNANLVMVPTSEISKYPERVIKVVDVADVPKTNAIESVDSKPAPAPSSVVTAVKKSSFDYSRLGANSESRQKHGSNTTLELRRIPPDMNSIAKINEHFARFGTLVNLQVGYDGDREAALVSFASHAQAMAAYRCSEPLFNNRFIKIFWHNPEKSGSANAASQPSTQGEVTAIETKPFPAAHQLQLNNTRNTKTSVVHAAAGVVKKELPSQKLASSDTFNKRPVPMKVVEPRPVASIVPKPAPAAFPSTRLNKNLQSSASTSVKLNSKELLKKEALKKKLELQKQSQQLLEKQISEQKLLFEKLANKKLGAEEKAIIIETIKKLAASVERLKTDLASAVIKLPATTGSYKTVDTSVVRGNSVAAVVEPTRLVRKRTISSTSAKQTAEAEPVPPKVAAVEEPIEPASSEPESLSAVESSEPQTPTTDVAASANDSANTSLLRQQVAALKREAANLGLLYQRVPVSQSPLLLRGQSRGQLPGDRAADRNRQLLVTGFSVDDKEDVLTHLLKFGDVDNSVINTVVPSISITYRKRQSAEKAVNEGTLYKSHRLTMSWQLTDGKSVPASPTVPDVRLNLSPVPVDSSAAKANSSIGFDNLELTSSPVGLYEDDIDYDDDALLAPEEEEDDENEGTRSWRR